MSLDICYLKGCFERHLIHAVERNENKQIYPIAIACMESECKKSWHWFLEILATHIGLPANMN